MRRGTSQAVDNDLYYNRTRKWFQGKAETKILLRGSKAEDKTKTGAK
jgi:hypothetical protein